MSPISAFMLSTLTKIKCFFFHLTISRYLSEEIIEKGQGINITFPIAVSFGYKVAPLQSHSTENSGYDWRRMCGFLKEMRSIQQ